MKDLDDFAAKNGFEVKRVAGTIFIHAPDKMWSWVIFEGLLSQYAAPYKKAQNRQQYSDDEAAATAALASMRLWLINAEKS